VDLSVARSVGRAVLNQLSEMGRMALFLLAACCWAFVPPLKLGRTVRQIHFIGVRSISVIGLTALFAGMVLSLQGYYTLRNFGSTALLGPAVGLSLIRELGPVLTALMVTARAGSTMAAEIGVMRITEQIDAIEVMALDPIKFLVSPRIAASLIAVPLLTAMFDVIGILGGALVAHGLLGVPTATYFTSMRDSVRGSDVSGGFIKSIAFGVVVTWVCAYKGFHAEHGAEGVGRATTEAVVLSSVLVLIGDYLLTSVLYS
jgi:phospholipid/cholesterol/gamma-HCH transport system permease protein